MQGLGKLNMAKNGYMSGNIGAHTAKAGINANIGADVNTNADHSPELSVQGNYGDLNIVGSGTLVDSKITGKNLAASYAGRFGSIGASATKDSATVDATYTPTDNIAISGSKTYKASGDKSSELNAEMNYKGTNLKAGAVLFNGKPNVFTAAVGYHNKNLSANVGGSYNPNNSNTNVEAKVNHSF